MNTDLQSLRCALGEARRSYELAPGEIRARRMAFEDALLAYYDAAKGVVTYEELAGEVGLSPSRVTQLLAAARRRAAGR